MAVPPRKEIDRARPHRAAGPPLVRELLAGRAEGPALPRDVAGLDRASLELLGWRDPKAPLRGYLVVDTGEGPVGVAVRR